MSGSDVVRAPLDIELWRRNWRSSPSVPPMMSVSSRLNAALAISGSEATIPVHVYSMYVTFLRVSSNARSWAGRLEEEEEEVKEGAESEGEVRKLTMERLEGVE